MMALEEAPTVDVKVTGDMKQLHEFHHALPDQTGRIEPSSGKTVIASEDFCLYYGPKVGVRNITMDIYPFAVTAIIGPSGCGKSTFLRSINRMNDLIPHTRATGTLAAGHQRPPLR